MRKPSFEASSDTLRCMDFLRSRQRASYLEISQHLGRDVRKRDRYVLESARKQLEREGIIFVIERNVGLSRANSEQIATLATVIPMERIKSVTHKAKKREKAVNVQELSSEARARFYIGGAVLGMIEMMNGKAAKKEVEKVVNAVSEPISLEETISLFSKMKPKVA